MSIPLLLVNSSIDGFKSGISCKYIAAGKIFPRTFKEPCEFIVATLENFIRRKLAMIVPGSFSHLIYLFITVVPTHCLLDCGVSILRFGGDVPLFLLLFSFIQYITEHGRITSHHI
jgi:hypothetical protein